MSKAYKCDVCKKLLEGEPVELHIYRLETYHYLEERVMVEIEFSPYYYDRCKGCRDMLIKDALQYQLLMIARKEEETESRAASEALEQEEDEA